MVTVSNSKARIWLRSLLGVAVILGGPAILIVVLRSAYQSSPEPGKVDRGVFDYAQPAQPSPSARTTETPVSSAPARSPGVTRVYECHKDGQLIYSGQPCGRDAIEREVNVRDMNAYTPSLRRGGECAELQNEIDQINARMRQAYSSAEGERLRERLRKLNDRLYALKCGR